MRTVYFRAHFFASFFLSAICALTYADSAYAECYAVTAAGTLVGATDLEVRDLNNSGHIVGWAMSNNVYQGFLYSNGVMMNLGSLGGQGCTAQAINDAGQVVGAASLSSGQKRAYLYTAGQMIDLGTLGGNESAAYAINNNGLVAGYSAVANGSCHLFTWRNGTRTDAGRLGATACEVWDINNGGTVIGLNQAITSQLLAFNWTAESGIQQLGTFGGAAGYPYRINDSGQIVGAIWTGQYILGMPIYHAFFYNNGGTTDLGTLGGSSSGATGVNSSGTVVGWSQVTGGQHAFIYSPSTGIRDLNTLISPTSGWVLETAAAINDAGQIAGTGRYKGQQLVYLLTPSQTDSDGNGLADACEPDPTTPSGPNQCGNGLPISLGLTLAGLAFVGRRRN